MTAADTSHVDDLVDLAVAAINAGDVAHAHDLAGQALAADATNVDATMLMATESPPEGEIRRTAILFCDLVGSTEISGRLLPEAYRRFLRHYQDVVREACVDRFEGSIAGVKGDGNLAIFGHPIAHENDAERAVRAGLAIVETIEQIAPSVEYALGERLRVRVGVHKGLVFLDRDDRDVYGLAANVGERVQSLAPVGCVVVSDTVRRLVEDQFVLEAQEPQSVKGLDGPLATFVVRDQRPRAAARSRRLGTPLVGRDDGVATLRAVWESVRDGSRERSACATIVGEPGIGKSRLAAAIAAEAEADGGTIVELAGSSFDQLTGLLPVRGLLEERSGISHRHDGPERLRRLRNEITAIGMDPTTDLAPLATLLGLAPETGFTPLALDARQLREQIERAALDYVRAGLDGPALLLVEDAQWLDDATRELVGQLVRSGPGTTMVLLTSRDEKAIPTGDAVEAIELDALTEHDAIRLVHDLAPELSSEEAAGIASRTGGVPLFVEELARRAGQTPASVPGEARHDLVDVPEVLYESIVAQLATSDDAMRVTTAAATIGHEIDRSLLACVLGCDEDEAARLLAGAVRSRLLEAAPASESRYRFRHDLLRSVAYELELPSRRADHHARIGQELVDRAGRGELVNWLVVADHFERAERHRDAAQAFEQAADAARLRGALHEARDLLGRAVDAAASTTDAPDRTAREVELRLQRGFLTMTLEGNSSTEAATDYERCLDLALADPGGDEMFSTLISLWSYYLSRGELDRGTEVLDVLATALTDERAAWQAANTGGYGLIAWYRGEFAEAVRLIEEALAPLEGDDRVRGDIDTWFFVPLDPLTLFHTYTAASRLMAGAIAGVAPQFDAARREAALLPFPQSAFSLAGSLSFEVWAWTELGDVEGARAAVAELLSVSMQHGLDSWALVASTQQPVVEGLAQLRSGDGDPAALVGQGRSIAMSVSLWQMVDQWVFVPFYVMVAGALICAGGEVEEGLTRLDEAQAIADRTGMHFYDAEILRHRARFGAADDEERASLLRRAVDLAASQHARIFQLRAALDLHAVDSGAIGDVAAAVGTIDEGVDIPEVTRARELLATSDGAG